MRPFKFRLEPVRRLRQAERDELRGKLADAYNAAEVLRGEGVRVAAELKELREHQRNATAASNMNVSLVLESQRYEMVLRGQQAAISEKVGLVEQEIERRRQAVAVAERGGKTFDRMEEKQANAHRREEERAEGKLLDEAGSIAAARRSTAPRGGND